jgi:hypothetical protein
VYLPGCPIGLTPTPPVATLNPGPVLPIFPFAPVGNIETNFPQKMYVCVFITAVPITMLLLFITIPFCETF